MVVPRCAAMKVDAREECLVVERESVATVAVDVGLPRLTMQGRHAGK